jgi:hypothetical protein
MHLISEEQETNQSKTVKIGVTCHNRLTTVRDRLRQHEGTSKSYEDAVTYLIDFYEMYRGTIKKLRVENLIID